MQISGGTTLMAEETASPKILKWERSCQVQGASKEVCVVAVQ